MASRAALPSYMRQTGSGRNRIGSRTVDEQNLSRQKTKNAVMRFRPKKGALAKSTTKSTHRRSSSLPSCSVATAAERSALRQSPERHRVPVRRLRVEKAIGRKPGSNKLPSVKGRLNLAELSPTSYLKHRKNPSFRRLLGPCADAFVQDLTASQAGIKRIDEFLRPQITHQLKPRKGKSQFQRDTDLAKKYGIDL